MAFRRPFRKTTRRTFRRGAPLARKRRTWITSVDANVCNFLEISLQDCEAGASQARIVLVNNTVLEDKFSDRAVVRRIVGHVWLAPTWDATTPTNDCNANFLAVASSYGQAFLGLRKYEKNGAGNVLPVDPMSSDDDFSEAQWLKTWQHLWIPTGEVNYLPEHDVVSCSTYVCADTHTTGALDNDFVDGTGTINIETECGDPVAASCTATQPAICQQTFKYPIPWHQPFDIKKRIPLREDQELGLEMDLLWPNAAILVNPRMQLITNFKVLLEF